MKKLITILSFAVSLISLAQSSKQFNPKAGLSVIGGKQNNKQIENPAPVFGIEFSMECPLDQGQKNHIRQKLSLIRLQGKDFKSVSAELNPQFKLVNSSSIELGIGPVAGMIFTKTRDNNKPVFTYGAGAGVVYYFKKIFIGIESRYGMTKKIAFDNINNKSEFVETSNLNSLRTFVKLGYQLCKR